MSFCDACFHRSDGSIYLGSFPSSLLAEHCQQDDPPARGYVVGNPHGIASWSQIEPQFPKLALKLAGIRLAQLRTSLGEQVDIELDPTELIVWKFFEPLGDLRFQFHGAPCHTYRLSYHRWYIKRGG